MTRDKESVHLRWARLRFSIIGPLLASPPAPGTLQAQLSELAAKTYRHPVTGEPVGFGTSTIERWYYQAKNHQDDPVTALARKTPSHAGTHPSISVALEQALNAQYRHHTSWSYQLHYDNPVALADQQPELGSVPSYSTVRRFMHSHGMDKKSKRGKNSAHAPFEARETRSFEVKYVHGLWHADFHTGSRRVLVPSGHWQPCHLLGVLDDRSGLGCHLQWYLQQTAEVFVHGLSQALLKRGLPRNMMLDGGSAMKAAETLEGLHRLGILHCPTLP